MRSPRPRGRLRLRDAVTAAHRVCRRSRSCCTSLALTLLHEIGAFPLAFYSDYLLEHRYGLSRQALGGWLADHLKGTARRPGAASTGLASLAVLDDARRSRSGGGSRRACSSRRCSCRSRTSRPCCCCPCSSASRRSTRLPSRERLERLAERAGARVMGVFRWELGAKTSKANAALAGIGRTRRILIADTMLDQYSDDEIEVVLAHELAHHVHRDIWTGIAYETVLTLVGFYAAHRVLGVARAARRADVARRSRRPAAAAACGRRRVSFVLMPAALALSRSHERRADRFALELTRNPAAFSSAMRRLGAQNLAEERPSRVVQWLFYSHPPLDGAAGRGGHGGPRRAGECVRDADRTAVTCRAPPARRAWCGSRLPGAGCSRSGRCRPGRP